MNSTTTAARLVQALQNVFTMKWSFLVIFIVILVTTVSICAATGFIPDAATASSTPATQTASAFTSYSPLIAGPAAAVATPATNVQAPTNGQINLSGDLPVAIKIPTIGVNATIANPDTLDVEALDSYLLKGAARYPTSATLGQQGNVILFGHSSYLPVVNNKAFKTFDGIQNLKQGDQIEVDSATTKYTYLVQTVQKMDATQDGIALTNTGYTLTLATCDSFTKKTARFVVTATLVGSSPIGN